MHYSGGLTVNVVSHLSTGWTLVEDSSINFSSYCFGGKTWVVQRIKESIFFSLLPVEKK